MESFEYFWWRSLHHSLDISIKKNAAGRFSDPVTHSQMALLLWCSDGDLAVATSHRYLEASETKWGPNRGVQDWHALFDVPTMDNNIRAWIFLDNMIWYYFLGTILFFWKPPMIVSLFWVFRLQIKILGTPAQVKTTFGSWLSAVPTWSRLVVLGKKTL